MDNKLLTQLRILKLTDSKPNFSELSRQYGVDRRTIKKYYDGYTGKPTHHDKPSKLDNYKELIRKKLSIKGTTLRSVYEFMISEVDSYAQKKVCLNQRQTSKKYTADNRFKSISVKINVVPELTASKQTKHKQYPCYQSKYLFFHISQTTHIASSSFQHFVSINTHINSIIFDHQKNRRLFHLLFYSFQ